jgi:hypothetical protein
MNENQQFNSELTAALHLATDILFRVSHMDPEEKEILKKEFPEIMKIIPDKEKFIEYYLHHNPEIVLQSSDISNPKELDKFTNFLQRTKTVSKKKSK